MPWFVGVWLLASAPACGTSAGRPGNAGSAGGADSAAGAGAGGDAQTLDPGRKELHRLNSAEYNATIQDVLGTTLQPANGNWRGGELGGFDNMAAVLGVDEAQYNRYFEAAKALATEVMASERLRGRFGACDLSDAACASSTIAEAGLRIFRRPLETDELRTYQRVYDGALTLGDDTTAALTLTLQALLSSAEFLYRIELDAHPESTEPHPLNAFELASRLSYFLWSSAPDEALLQAASNGSLSDPEVLSATVDRMLDDPKSERLATNFAGQWLGARQVLSHPTAPKFYQWYPRVAQAASQELLLYFGEFLHGERSWFEFPTADFNYIDGELAVFYDIPATVTGFGTFERVEAHDDKRAGFFGLAGFLAVTSLDRRTSPSKRGRWIAGNLLCSEPPKPPNNMVPKLEAVDEAMGGGGPTLNVRQSLEQHRQNPDCAGCHALFDPYGLALESYDAIGLYRSTYEDGTPIDPQVTLLDGQAFSGLDGLARSVAGDPKFGACLAQKLFTYGMGRPLTPSDEPHLQQAEQAWLSAGETPSVRRLLHLLIASDAFRFRRGGE